MSARSRLLAVARTPMGVLAILTLLALLFLAIFGPIIWGQAANQDDIAAILEGPSHRHLLGTDSLGRDVLARTLVASRLSLVLALLATALAAGAGVIVGAIPSVLPPRARGLLAGFINLTVAFPGLLVAIFAATAFGIGARGAVLALGLAGAPSFARLTQTLAASVGESDYIAAARMLGAGRARLVLRYVLPNIAEPLLLNATVAIGGSLLALSGLSFLGLGVQPPAYDWGQILNQGLDRIFENPAVSLAPGVAIVLAGLSFNLLGEILAQVMGFRTPAGARWRSPAEQEAEGVAAEAAGGPGEQSPLLEVEGLSVAFPSRDGPVEVLSDVSFSIAPGEAVGLVGESGSGKSMTAMAVAQLVPHPGLVQSQRMRLEGRELEASGPGMQRFLGTSLALVFQDPMTSLNPALSVGRQLTEAVEVHRGASHRQALELAAKELREVRIGAPERRLSQYPHELSGGMRQRTVIAMGLMAEPRLLIADEPTTSLDVTVQREVLSVLRTLRDEQGVAVLLISHDIAVVAQLCRRVLVMYAGRIVEELPVEDLVAGPAHPYTRALLSSLPSMDSDRERTLTTIPGQPPQPGALPPGCPFAPRCAHAGERCQERPPLVEQGPGRLVACWYPQAGPVAAAATRA